MSNKIDSSDNLQTINNNLLPAEEDRLLLPRSTEGKSGKKTPWKTILFLFLLVLIIAGINTLGFLKIPDWLQNSNLGNNLTPNLGIKIKLPKAEVKSFASKEEMLEYLQKGDTQAGTMGMGMGISRDMVAFEGDNANSTPAAPRALMKSESMAAQVAGQDRASGTNVQVAGIDEPDIVKTDGKQIYFSSQNHFIQPLLKRVSPTSAVQNDIAPNKPLIYRNYGNTQIISAFPPADLKQTGQIDISGNLLLKNNKLIVLGSDNKIYGYDVVSPDNPKLSWSFELAENNMVETAREMNGKVYLITRTYLNRTNPCPYQPFKSDESISIPCTSMYHPVPVVSVDSTYSIMVINPDTGKVENSTAFVGSTGNSTVYMSSNNLYLTYTYSGDFIAYITNFFSTKGKDILPSAYLERLSNLQSYELSQSAKMTELSVIFNEFQQSFSNDDRMKFENELNNRMEEYAKAHIRELERTGIVKIDTGSLRVTANGDVAGHPLNQFALDEYQNNLRIATTVSNNFWGFGGTSAQSVNDVTVLSNDLKVIGSVQNLGISERIYSARFIDDKAYIVTFRQTDPFYVLDLSDPNNPQLKGELKIPGFSSYLHPLAKNSILGVGMDQGKVKLSLFDVSDASNPVEKEHYNVDEYWTEVSSNHHAFLQDEKHQIFFMPGGKGGYIFSYKGDELKLQKTISDTQVKRALYINDYLYVIGENKIVVLNQSYLT